MANSNTKKSKNSSANDCGGIKPIKLLPKSAAKKSTTKKKK